jgi:single-strand DNA-binding protein
MPTARSQTRKSASTTKEAAKKTANQNTYGEREPASLSGNLTRDPELRFTASGIAVASCSVAVNERVLNPDTQEWEDTEPEFYPVSVWRQQAEHFAECFRKGDRIVAIGYFQDRTYIGSDEEEHTVTEFTARDIGPSLLFVDATIRRVQRSSRRG